MFCVCEEECQSNRITEPQGDENTGLLNYLPEEEKKSGGRTAWQKRTGLKGIGPLKKGLLKKVGYSVSASKTRRHAAVKRAVKKYGRASTIRKLNAVAVYTRKRSPVISRTFKSDMKFAQKMKGGVELTQLDQLKQDITMAELEFGGDPDKVPQDEVNTLLERGVKLGVKYKDNKDPKDLATLKIAVNAKLGVRGSL
jgi:hypothetical protein